METFWQDIRFGGRMLLKNKGFTVVAIFALALGIGASTAIFSAVNPILFKSLPYPNASRIMMIREMNGNGRAQLPAFGTYYGLAERNHSFDALAVMKPWLPTMTGAAQPERLEGQSVSANYFHVLGVPPILGRDFQPSDDRLHGAAVTILSYKLWQRFGGDSNKGQAFGSRRNPAVFQPFANVDEGRDGLCFPALLCLRSSGSCLLKKSKF